MDEKNPKKEPDWNEAEASLIAVFDKADGRVLRKDRLTQDAADADFKANSAENQKPEIEDLESQSTTKATKTEISPNHVNLDSAENGEQQSASFKPIYQTAEEEHSRPRIQRNFNLPRAATQTNIRIPLSARQPTRPIFRADTPPLESSAHEKKKQDKKREILTPSWSERGGSNGTVDQELTTKAWGAQRLPFGQETVAPVAKRDEIFEIECELAQNKSGTLYIARLPQTKVPVALKVLSAALSIELNSRQRFRREIRSHAALSHPNIVQVYRYGRRRGRYFMATELLLGSLEELIDLTGALPTAICAIILEDILKGIQYAHLRQVLHRELKPSNILISSQGDFKIGDFSVAKSALDPNESQSNALFGTPSYMSPEQASGRKLGPRSDLFAIASIGFYMCTGIEAYRRPNTPLTLEAVKQANAPTPLALCPSAHPLLARIITKMGQRDPKRRYESAYEALRELWPLSRLVQKRYPKVRQQFAKNPERICKQLREDECKLELEHADRIKDSSKTSIQRSALAIYRAYAIAPENPNAQRALDECTRQHGFRFERGLQRLLIDNLRPLDAFSADSLSRKAIQASSEGRLWDSYRFFALSAAADPSDEKMQSKVEALGERSKTSPFDRGKLDQYSKAMAPKVGSSEQEVARGSSVSFKLKGAAADKSSR